LNAVTNSLMSLLSLYLFVLLLLNYVLFMSNEVGGVAAWHRTDCQALVVGTKVVVQPVCRYTLIQGFLDISRTKQLADKL